MKTDNKKQNICGKHRDNLGVGWKREVECAYPEHKGGIRATEDSVSWSCYEQIIKKYPEFPILGSVCKICRKSVLEDQTPKKTQLNFSELPGIQASTSELPGTIEISPNKTSPSTKSSVDSLTSPSSDGSIFSPQKSFYIDEREKAKRRKLYDDMCKALEIKPVHTVNLDFETAKKRGKLAEIYEKYTN